jgi:hypothetical protein
MPPQVVLRLLKNDGINKWRKLFDAEFFSMASLAGSGIEAMVAIPNKLLADLACSSRAAKDWVKRNVQRYDFHGGVTIKWLVSPSPPFDGGVTINIYASIHGLSEIRTINKRACFDPRVSCRYVAVGNEP